MTIKQMYIISTEPHTKQLKYWIKYGWNDAQDTLNIHITATCCFPECSKQLSHLHEKLCYVSYLNFTYNLCRIIHEGLYYVSHLNSTYNLCRIIHEGLCYVSHLSSTYNLCRITHQGLCYVSHLNSTYNHTRRIVLSQPLELYLPPV